ncbi:MAG: NAD(P)/FAD-dependent oxidoreductase, partial [Bacillota bacterium]|nr:NAD(P)/FAD-dependent oxidoreductase [Bacillota bacterium]
MKLIINNIRASVDDDLNSLKYKSAKKLNVSSNSINGFKIVKESIDARRKPNISLVYSVMVEINSKYKIPVNSDIRLLEETTCISLNPGDKNIVGRPVVVGFGPSGMFAALVLAQNGYKPIVIERGESMEKRTQMVNTFWKDNLLNTETNVQFGEGGAGTFSDGKLTTRINDARCEKVLEELYKHGAPEEILYKNKPHIGTDILKNVVVNIRRKIEELGGEVFFNSKLTGLNFNNNTISGIEINDRDIIDTNILIIAIGHSARDTFEMMLQKGIQFEQKPFSIGVRIEHPQEIINLAQYGSASIAPRLGPADYQLFYKTNGRTVYSFCMCPGGIVVASASEHDTIVTNG